MINEAILGELVLKFFENHLKGTRGMSSNTIASYSTCVSLFFKYTCESLKITVDRLQLDHFSQDLVLQFLKYLESERENLPQTRNTRLAALRTFFRFIGINIPKWKHLCDQICAIQFKKTVETPLVFLSKEEVDVFLLAPNTQTLLGARDHALFVLLYTTGARVQELANLKVEDIYFEGVPKVKFYGKGRKIREVPLTTKGINAIKLYLKQRETAGIAHIRLFLNRRNDPLTRFGIRHIVQSYHQRLKKACQSLKGKKISPHTFRHTFALHALEAGIHLSVIQEWLGHADINTTQRYIDITMAMKSEALERLFPASDKDGLPEWKQPEIIIFLQKLQKIA